MEAGPSLTAWYRVVFGGSMLLLWGYALRQPPKSLPQADPLVCRPSTPRKLRHKWWVWSIAAGLFFAMDLALWHQSILDAGAGISTFLVNLNVFYLILFGVCFLGESMSWRYLLYVVGAMTGSLLLIDITDWHLWSLDYKKGLIFALLAGVAYSGFILCQRQAEYWGRIERLQPTFVLGLSSMVTAFFLSIDIWFAGDSYAISREDVPKLLALAIVAQVLGWSFIGRALPKLKVSVSGLLLLLQPVLASVWAWLLFAENWTSPQIIGACLVILCIYAGNLEHHRRLGRALAELPK